MAYDIFATPIFKKQFDKLCRKYPSFIEDVDALKKSLLSKPIQGKSLGQGLYKVRLTISSKGQGKSGGARVITWVKLIDNKIVLITVYDKSEQETINVKDLLKLI